MKSARPFGNNRARDSIATKAPEAGLAYSRRRVAQDAPSATAQEMSRCASAEGTVP